MIKKELDNRQWKYETIIGDDYDDRFNQAVYHIDKILGKLI